MDLPFAYYEPAVGSDFINRKKETELFFKTIIEEQKGISLYDAPKTGKHSFVLNGLSRLKAKKYAFSLCEINLSNINSYNEFVALFIKKMHSLAREINKNAILPFDIQIEGLDNNAILNLPEVMAQEAGHPVIIYFREFQNIFCRDGEDYHIEDLEKIWNKHSHVRYLITGSFINPMKYIFEEKKYFYYMTNNITLSKLTEKEFCDYVTKTFLNVGRVIQPEEAKTIFEITSGNLWYMKLICSMCLSQPAGYINRSVVLQARDMLLSINIPRFLLIIADLTPNQINFLKPILDGVQKFSSSEILEKYALNSSANVFRLKEALKKKEVISYNEDEEFYIIDPLFVYWLNNYYFI